jgi:methylated-DNA-[protein]-cysteine S-methyltransferase
MTGRGYTIFDTGIGRCGIAWGPSGIIGVQLPEVREIDTRRRLFQLYPDARERRPPPNVQVAIEGIAALLRGAACDFAEVALDMTGIPVFNQRVYAYARSIPRGETRTYAEIASALRASGAVYSVAQAIGRNPFMIIVPCHRVLEAGNYADKDFTAWRGDLQAPAAVDRGHQPHRQQDAVRRAAAGCTTPHAYLSLPDDGDHASRTQIHFRFRLSLHRGAWRQAVCGAA